MKTKHIFFALSVLLLLATAVSLFVDSSKSEEPATAGVPTLSHAETITLAEASRQGDMNAQKTLQLYFVYAPMTDQRLSEQSHIVALARNASLKFQLTQDIAARFACKTAAMAETLKVTAAELKYAADTVEDDLKALQNLPPCPANTAIKIEGLLSPLP